MCMYVLYVCIVCMCVCMYAYEVIVLTISAPTPTHTHTYTRTHTHTHIHTHSKDNHTTERKYVSVLRSIVMRACNNVQQVLLDKHKAILKADHDSQEANKDASMQSMSVYRFLQRLGMERLCYRFTSMDITTVRQLKDFSVAEISADTTIGERKLFTDVLAHKVYALSLFALLTTRQQCTDIVEKVYGKVAKEVDILKLSNAIALTGTRIYMCICMYMYSYAYVILNDTLICSYTHTLTDTQ